MRIAGALVFVLLSCSAAVGGRGAGEGSLSASPREHRHPRPRVAAPSRSETGTPQGARELSVGPARISRGERPPWEAARAGVAAPTGISPTWRLKKTIHVGVGYLQTVELSPGGDEVYVVSHDDGIVRRYATQTGRLVQQFSVPGFQQFDGIALGAVEDRGLYVSTRSAAHWLDLASGVVEEAASLPAYPDLRAAPQSGLFGLANRRTEPQSGDLLFGWIGSDRSFRSAFGVNCSERPDASMSHGLTITALAERWAARHTR